MVSSYIIDKGWLTQNINNNFRTVLVLQATFYMIEHRFQIVVSIFLFVILQNQYCSLLQVDQQERFMNKTHQLYKILACGAVIGLGYFGFKFFTSDKERTLEPVGEDLDQSLTETISQQIKNQMLLACSRFVRGIEDNIEESNRDSSGKLKDNFVNFFEGKMQQIYKKKQNQILNKHKKTAQSYEKALKKYQNNGNIAKNNNEIIDIMQRSVRGEYPNFSVDKKIQNSFSKLQIKKYSKQINISILTTLAQKLKQEKERNPSFDPSNDAEFVNYVRAINVTEIKRRYLLNKGFKNDWGCSVQIFIKLSEMHKLKDKEFQAQMDSIQNIYNQMIEKIADNPLKFSIESLGGIYNQVQEINLSKSAEGPKSPEKMQKKLSSSVRVQKQPVQDE